MKRNLPDELWHCWQQADYPALWCWTNVDAGVPGEGGADNPKSHVQEQAPIKRAIRAVLGGLVWRQASLVQSELAKILPRDRQSTIDMAYFCCMAELSIGNGQNVAQTISFLKRQKAPVWILHSLEVSLAGRRLDFKKHAKITQQNLGNQTVVHAANASIHHGRFDPTACLHQLNQDPLNDAHRLLLAYAYKAAKMHDKALVLLEETDSPQAAAQRGDVYFERGSLREALINYDSAVQSGWLDWNQMRCWLMIVISHPSGWPHLAERVKHAFTIVPSDPRMRAVLATHVVIWCWVRNDWENAQGLLQGHLPFASMPELAEDKNEQVFFKYCCGLHVHRRENGEPYQGVVNHQIFVIGESHSLSPCNTIGRWGGQNTRFQAAFVMGVKMYHLAQQTMNVHKACVSSQIVVHRDDELLFTIGEIDCRPEGGIWSAAKKANRTLHEVVTETVDGYLEFIRENTRSHLKTITIQGVPAPAYALIDKQDPGDKTGFLLMIRDVNERLKAGCMALGWSFLDVYSATADENGQSNLRWHLDGWHLKPSFYQQADEWLIKP